MALLWLAIEILFGECWMGSAFAILQDLAEKTNSKGTVLSLYLFVGTLIGSGGTLVVGLLDDGETYQSLQRTLFLTSSVAYIGGSFMFFLLANQLKTIS